MFKINASAAMRGFACFSVAVSAAALADPISDAGLKDKDVKQAVVESFANGYVYIPGSLRTLAPEARAAFVRAAGQLAIAYGKSEAFRQDYAAWWDEHKPKLELISPQDMQQQNDSAKASFSREETERKGVVAQFEAQRAAFRKAGMSDAQIDGMIAQAKQGEQQIEQMRKQGQLPSEPQLMSEQERQQQNTQRQQEYQQRLAKFQAEHPADPREAIRHALNEFLALSASVDFNAKVVNGRFVDPAYQGKDDQWKRCFRAGKPAVDAARDVAQGWLQQV
ncbi:MAG: hypothetical protein ACHQIO_08170 [Nevskiales bacterium]